MKAAFFDGGNNFDDIHVDLNGSHKLLTANKSAAKGRRYGFIRSFWNFIFDATIQKFKLAEFASLMGIHKRWFNEFLDFWMNFLGGRPVTLMDFHLLRYDYRKRCQTTQELDWSTKNAHLENWQTSQYLSLVFNYTYKFALHPIQQINTWKYLKKNSKVLEYGCALAPMYRNYRDYFSHRNIEWHLADIPTHAFLYSKYTYSKDHLNVHFHDILPANMNSPIDCKDEDFDVIYCNMVYEHLNSPLEVSQFLMRKLKKGGIFIFDYVKSEGTELDTAQGVTERIETLKFLKQHLEIIEGARLVDLNEDVGLTVGKKR